MFDQEAMAAKLATNTRKVQLFTFDRAGYLVESGSGPIGYGDTDLWPIRFAEQLDEILTNGSIGHSYPLNDWWTAKVM